MVDFWEWEVLGIAIAANQRSWDVLGRVEGRGRQPIRGLGRKAMRGQTEGQSNTRLSGCQASSDLRRKWRMVRRSGRSRWRHVSAPCRWLGSSRRPTFSSSSARLSKRRRSPRRRRRDDNVNNSKHPIAQQQPQHLLRDTLLAFAPRGSVSSSPPTFPFHQRRQRWRQQLA
ncbi:hypothetical protein DFP72DRAFT_1167188, partial [Ephemerocybe angulata]